MEFVGITCYTHNCVFKYISFCHDSVMSYHANNVHEVFTFLDINVI